MAAYVIVWLLITSPVALPSEYLPCQPVLLEALKAFNEQHEIASRKESYGSWASEYLYTYNHYRELADAPSIVTADAFLMPSDCWTAFRETYTENAREMQVCRPHRYYWYEAAIQETKQLENVHQCLRVAKCETNSLVMRRRGLQQLRLLIGREAFEAGRLPPPVPVHRFSEF